jgi:hypothetical protein
MNIFFLKKPYVLDYYSYKKHWRLLLNWKGIPKCERIKNDILKGKQRLAHYSGKLMPARVQKSFFQCNGRQNARQYWLIIKRKRSSRDIILWNRIQNSISFWRLLSFLSILMTKKYVNSIILLNNITSLTKMRWKL